MTGIDAWRVQRAVHEVGHLVVWREAGGRIRQVRLTRSGGYVDVTFPAQNTPDLRLGLLAGLIAGGEADKLWCARTTGVRHDPGTCTDDLARIRRARRKHVDYRQWSDGELVAEARRRLLARWGEIERLAATLAERGRL